VNGVADLLNGQLRLKARYAEDVLFQDLKMHTLDKVVTV
jgi:hypothetical protein